jgi:ubiquinone/menaquinone biosynthesis C-methylase UbiE
MMRQLEGYGLRYAHRLPRSVTKWLRHAYFRMLDLRDRFTGRSNPDVPPRSLQLVGVSADYLSVGRRWLAHFVDVADLRPDDAVLDIGCGPGRMATPLLGYLSETGSYVGFDINAETISWNDSHIASRNSRFRFVFADIRNKEYNPRGAINASEYRFPCADESIDFAFAGSVFTHMRSADIRHYLAEVRRCLKVTGRALLTFFVLDVENLRLVETGKAQYDFRAKLDDCYTIDRQVPERAVAYTDAALRELVTGAGLAIREPILWGSWSGRASMLNTQDAVIVVRREATI